MHSINLKQFLQGQMFRVSIFLLLKMSHPICDVIKDQIRVTATKTQVFDFFFVHFSEILLN